MKANNLLFELAAQQAGYFTAKQAHLAGFNSKNHAYHVQSGNWIKEWRGIYRIANFPEPDDSQYVLWSLWAHNRNGEPQGVYTHKTALELFELSDVNPDKLDLTVPKNFRKRAPTPVILNIHKKNILQSDCEERTGYKVLKPIPNLIMLIQEETLTNDILIQAIRDGIKKGLFIKQQLKNLELDPKTKAQLNQLLVNVNS